jgi:hypothetical protein
LLGKQLQLDFVAHYHHVGAAAELGLGENTALGEVVALDFEVILVAGNHLHVGVGFDTVGLHFGCARDESRHTHLGLVAHGFFVEFGLQKVDGWVLLALDATALEAVGVALGVQLKRVGPQAGEGFRQRVFHRVDAGENAHQRK